MSRGALWFARRPEHRRSGRRRGITVGGAEHKICSCLLVSVRNETQSHKKIKKTPRMLVLSLIFALVSLFLCIAKPTRMEKQKQNQKRRSSVIFVIARYEADSRNVV